MAKKKLQDQKKKQRERRVAQKKLAEAAKRRELAKSSEETTKGAPVKKTFAPTSETKTDYVAKTKQNNNLPRRTGG